MSELTLLSSRFRRVVAIAALTLMLWTGCIAPASAEGFVLCADEAGCDRADYFVGYRHSARASVGGTVQAAGEEAMQLFPGVADLEAQLDEGAIAISVASGTAQEQLSALSIGHAKTTHQFDLPVDSRGAIQSDAETTDSIKAAATLVWGDTLQISSKRLPEGSPLALRIERVVANEKAVATAGSSARLTLQTWVDGRQVPKLGYQLAKFAGEGEQDREQGAREASVSALVPVGNSVRLESRLQVEDGLVAQGGSETFEGSHGVSYRVVLDSDDSCARSESGVLTTGDCD